jgi:hypothetical protein
LGVLVAEPGREAARLAPEPGRVQHGAAARASGERRSSVPIASRQKVKACVDRVWRA